MTDPIYRKTTDTQCVFVLDYDDVVEGWSIISHGYDFPVYTQGKTVEDALRAAADFIRFAKECEEGKHMVRINANQ